MSFEEFIDEPLNERGINIGRRVLREYAGNEFSQYDSWTREIEFVEYRFIRIETFDLGIYLVLRGEELIHKLEFKSEYQTTNKSTKH